MKLLTINCHCLKGIYNEKKIDTITDIIIKEKYDVIALQEVDQLFYKKEISEESNLKRDNFMLLLLENLNDKCCDLYKGIWEFSHKSFLIYEEGICILSRHEIINIDRFLLSKTKNINMPSRRMALKVSIKYNEVNVNIICCHLGINVPFGDYKVNQIKRLINGVGDELTFVLGDLNMDAKKGGKEYDTLQCGLIDTYNISKNIHGKETRKGRILDQKGTRIDYILTNKEVDVELWQTVFHKETGKAVSDHCGVEVFVNI